MGSPYRDDSPTNDMLRQLENFSNMVEEGIYDSVQSHEHVIREFNQLSYKIKIENPAITNMLQIQTNILTQIKSDLYSYLPALTRLNRMIKNDPSLKNIMLEIEDLVNSKLKSSTAEESKAAV